MQYYIVTGQQTYGQSINSSHIFDKDQDAIIDIITVKCIPNNHTFMIMIILCMKTLFPSSMLNSRYTFIASGLIEY